VITIRLNGSHPDVFKDKIQGLQQSNNGYTTKATLSQIRPTVSGTQNNYYVNPRYNDLAFVPVTYLLFHYNDNIQSLPSMFLHTR